MARNPKGISPEVWASAASGSDVTPIENFTLGYTAAYQSDLYPDRRHLNVVLQRVTATASDVNKYGAALPWDSAIAYQDMAIVTHEEEVYIALQANTNVNPLNGVAHEANWITIKDFLALPDIKTGTAAIKITGHANSLTQNTNGTWTYNISDFTLASGYPTSKIRKLYVKIFAFSFNGSIAQVYASFPWAKDTLEVVGSISTDSTRTAGSTVNTIIEIPINSGQDYLKFRVELTGASQASFTILGAQLNEI